MIQLKEAVFKGVSFLFDEASTTGGNRTIKFNFPGSDDQAVEVQGEAPKSFTMSIILPHENYYEEKEALLRVLDDGTPGPLTHPTFGAVPNVVSGAYTLIEKISELGRAMLTVTFDQDTARGVPVSAGALPAQVAQQADETIAQALSVLSEGFDVSLTFPSNFGDAREAALNIPDAVRAASRVAEPIAAEATKLNRQLNDFTGAVGALIQAPADLTNSIRLSFETLANLYETPAETLGAMRLLFDFGTTDPTINQNTAGRMERARNRQLLRLTVRTLALCYAYPAAAQVTFDTTAQLDATAEGLEGAYIAIISESGSPNETLEQLDRLRVQAQASLDAARVNTRSIITIETPRRPLSVIVYEYYGSTDLVDAIAELNNITQNAFVEGPLQVLAG